MFNFIHVFEGFLIDRDNDHRFFDKVYKYIPFVPKIKTMELGTAMVREAEKFLENQNLQNDIVKAYNNKEIKLFLNK